MQVAQNKCIRYCLNLSNTAHIGTKEFEKINWLPTKERFEQYVWVSSTSLLELRQHISKLVYILRT